MGAINTSINALHEPERRKEKNSTIDKMSTEQKQSGCGKMYVGAAVIAAGAGAYYYHKDMSEVELREAGEMYMEKTKEYSVKAYETAKPYAILAAEKAVEGSKCAYAKLMAILYPEEQSEIDASTFDEPESQDAEVEETEVAEDY